MPRPRERAEIRQRRIGFVFQTFNLIPYLSALENVQVPLMLAGSHVAEQQHRVAELLARVGLEGRLDHKPSELSIGQQQRVALARTLANDPAVILADEPTGNLDPGTREQVLDFFEELCREGRTVVMVTHDPAAAARADRTIKLADGAVVSDSRPAGTQRSCLATIVRPSRALLPISPRRITLEVCTFSSSLARNSLFVGTHSWRGTLAYAILAALALAGDRRGGLRLVHAAAAGRACEPRPTSAARPAPSAIRREFKLWHGSDHDRAMELATDETVLGDFNDAKFERLGVTTRFFRRDGKFMVNTEGPDGENHDYEIKYTFGVDPLQQYMVEFPDGRVQVLRVSWDTHKKRGSTSRRPM